MPGVHRECGDPLRRMLTGMPCLLNFNEPPPPCAAKHNTIVSGCETVQA